MGRNTTGLSTKQALANVSDEYMEQCIIAYESLSGRPTSYNEMIGAEIITRLANNETLRKICEDEHMPNFGTVYRWMGKDEFSAFRHGVAAARRFQAMGMVEEGKEILDDAPTDSMAHVQKADKRAQYRLNIAKSFDRETFGDKVQQDVNVRGVVIHTDNTELAKLMNSDD
jgi:hypothetical protein